ncbi:MAG: GNAT family N-acetyltransferase [Citrobacter sp.]
MRDTVNPTVINSLGLAIDARVKLALMPKGDVVWPMFNEWFKYYPIDVYIRSTRRILNGTEYLTLDFSSCSVHPAQEGKGYYAALTDRLQSIADKHGMALYAENVLNDKLIPFYEKRGYIKLANDNCFGACPSYYRPPQ